NPPLGFFHVAEDSEDCTAGAGKRSPARTCPEEFAFDFAQERVTRKHHALEIVSWFCYLTTRTLLPAQTLNFFGFIQNGQPRRGLTGRDCSLRNNHNESIIRLVLHRGDLVSATRSQGS